MNPKNLAASVATAVLGVDTLFGGDVANPSGTGRFIADSWFSDEPLPLAYTHPAAARLRESGGVTAKQPDRAAIDAYLAAVGVRAAIDATAGLAKDLGGARGGYLAGLADSCHVMWDLAMELLGKGPAVPYERCVLAAAGAPPSPSDPAHKRERVQELLAKAGHPSADGESLLAAVDAWRRQRLVPMAAVKALGAAFIAEFDALCVHHLLPHLPAELRRVPRANIAFLPIQDAWFSGSMNYLGRARRPGGEPEYEASYEINASLQISVPEFMQLVSHEVVPGHVTTFAFLQNLWWRKLVGFEASVPTMNTRAAALYEGIANNAILIAHGVAEVDALPDPDLQIGVLLALLQDDAKNQASWATWAERRERAEVAGILRREFLVSAERADKLSGAWGRHPLLGRMYLPCYRAGTEKVAELRRRHEPGRVLPVLYGAAGLVDVVTIDAVLAAR
ncbi:MAG: hypothetical protein FJ265_04235 [Planctomycetes bacterium]|nr:hypothetical protein [Planctomycetota bacterium]